MTKKVQFRASLDNVCSQNQRGVANASALPIFKASQLGIPLPPVPVRLVK